MDVEKIREDWLVKSELAHARQIGKAKESRLEIERHAQELSAKSEEITEVRRLYEELKSDLQRKDSFLQHLSSAHEKLRLDFGEKVVKLEGENREMVLSLDEATARIQDLEKQIRASNLEISDLKRLLVVKQKKPPQEAQAGQSLDERENIMLKLEEENRIAQDQLKWKIEQFKHLEEAHEKLQDNFRKFKLEAEQEKSALIEEISSLQTSLDSRTQISESFQVQLKMCNQAFAHEESRRKVIEIEFSEFRSRYKNVFSEYEEAKSKMEHMILQRDDEIGELRSLVRKQETQSKEIKYRNAHLEQENQELLGSVKEFQEAQLRDATTTPSLKKLKNKLQSLEQLHSKCSVSFKDKEAEWSANVEKLTEDLRCSTSELKEKDEQIRELRKELDSVLCSLEAQTEENSILMTVFKSEHNVVCSEALRAKAEYETKNLKVELEESQKAHSYEKDLLEIVEEQKAEIVKLQDQIGLLELSIDRQKEAAEALKQDNEGYKEIAQDRLFSLENLQSETAWLRQSLTERELEIKKLSSLQLSSEKEKALLKIIHEKDQKIKCLQDEATSLEKDFLNVVTSLKEKQKMFEEALMRAENQKVSEMEDRSNTIRDLKKEADNLRHKLELQGTAFIHTEEEAMQLRALLQDSRSEAEGLKFQFRDEKSCLEGIMKDLKSLNETLLEDIAKLSADREGFILQMERIAKEVDKLCAKDVELSGMLGRMTQNSDINTGASYEGDTRVPYDSACWVIGAPLSLPRKGSEENSYGRAPLIELNS